MVSQQVQRLAAGAAVSAAAVAVVVGYVRRRRGSAAELPVLTYLDVPGVGDQIRLTLRLGGVAFVDERVTYEEVAARRAAGALPCGQVPTLRVGGATYCQSGAILRWAGDAAGLRPTAPGARLRCDMVCDALDELRRDLNPLWYGAALRRDPRTGEPGVPLDDDQRAAARAAVPRYLAAGFARLETVLGAGPYFCGRRPSICDVALFVDGSQILEGAFAADVGVGPDVLAACPSLRALILRVGRHPRLRARVGRRVT